MQNNIHEMQLKIQFIRWILRTNERRDLKLIVNEFAANNSRARADLMFIRGDCLTAVEIKSPKDRLDRLSSQLQYLTSTYNRVEVVIAERHKSAAFEICRLNRVGLHVFAKGKFSTLLKGRRRNIDEFKLKNHLFPLRVRERNTFKYDEFSYREFLMRKYAQNQTYLLQMIEDAKVPTPELIRCLNPHYELRNKIQKKRHSYIELIQKNVAKIQSIQSSSNVPEESS